MSIEERAWRAIDRIARSLNTHSPKQVLDDLKHEVGKRSARALGKLVSNLTGRELKAPRPGLMSGRIARVLPENTLPTSEATEQAPAPASLEPAPPPPPELEPLGEEEQRASGALESVAVPLVSPAVPPLPEPFGIDRVVLLAGDSEWAFAYWEIDPARLQSITGAPPAKAELRLVDEQEAVISRSCVAPTQGRQHLRIPRAGQRYRAELVSADAGSEGTSISRSRWVVATHPGEDTSAPAQEASQSPSG